MEATTADTTTTTDAEQQPPEPPAETRPIGTSFSDALKAVEQQAGKTLEVVTAAEIDPGKPSATATSAADTSFIPEELLTKETPPVEVKDDVLSLELPPTASKASHINFGKLRDHAKALAAEREALRAELEAARKAPAADDKTAAELKAEREARAALEEKLERAAFTESPKFKQFEAREGDQLAGAKAYLDGAKDMDGNAIDPDIVETAARLSGLKRLDVLRKAGLDEVTIAAVTPHLAALDTIAREKKVALDNYKTEAEAYRAQETLAQEKQAAARQAEEKRLFAEVGREIAEKVDGLRKVPGQDAWNKHVDDITARAEQIFSGGVPVRELAEMSYRAAIQEDTQRINVALREKLAAALAQNKKLTAIQPDAGVRNGSHQNGETTPGQRWNASLAAAGGRG